MSNDAVAVSAATAPTEDALPVVDVQDQPHTIDQIECAKDSKPQPQPQSRATFLHSPPDSNNAEKSETSDSELSELEDEPLLDDAPPMPTKPEYKPGPEPEPVAPVQDEEEIEEVLPDHWSSGNVPVFKPTMDQFKDFKRFMERVDSYGMKSGIIKIIPPAEWKDAQPQLDELVKQVKVREPIKQDIMGSNGTYRQVNILHGRSYNIPQWRQLCEQSEHQPPARRGERRANADKPKAARARPAAPRSTASSAAKTRGRGRPPKTKGKQKQSEEEADRPMTPVSPLNDAQGPEEKVVDSIEEDPGIEDDGDGQPTVRRMGGVRPTKAKTQSTSARRKYSRREGSAVIDEAAFKDFDYRMDISDYTPERCEELERAYWKTLTYAPPLYGADLMGSLFDDRTESWNLNKLPNLLDVLGTKVPGVNTAYLYLGMWKATFAWHLEDVDLYSINYLHFGAPKQWYSISQADARRFEASMKSIWPTDAKACDQFLRHKAFLISPQHLLQNYGIRVNKVVSYPGEFVVTYPYGYHSGYNLGYNCAEAVNFALDSWLEMGKIAKKCDCAQAQDSVWVNVYEIERKLRGEETEYEETEEEEDDDDDPSGLPTPPATGVRFKDAGRKRKRGPGEKGGKIKVKKIKLRLKVKADPPCCLCPNDVPGMRILSTDDGRRAHRLCALYIPETYIDIVDGDETICNISTIHKDRLDLKCLFCRSKRGACFQCSQGKCARAYHATCAAAAGVFTEEQDVPVFGEDGTEYKEQAFEFSCRFHRAKRDKKLDGDALEADGRIQTAALELKKGDICQMQYYKGEIFAGTVVENRAEEHMLLVDVLPNGDRIEVEWKWLLLPDESDYHLPKASSKAIPLPASQKAKDKLNAKRQQDDKPRKGDTFVEGCTWTEFHTAEVTNKEQAKVDLSKENQIWFYLGKTSTDAKAQYTEDPSNPRHNPRGNYLDTLPKPVKPIPAPRQVYRHQSYSIPGSYSYPNPSTGLVSAGIARFEKPYVYKPKTPVQSGLSSSTPSNSRNFISTSAGSLSSVSQHQYQYSNQNPQTSAGYSLQGFGASSGTQQLPHAQQTIPQAQAQAPSLAEVGPKTAPTSSTQLYSRPTWQVHSSVYQKYAFFQVNHNRDSSKYRTPYSSWGGFTNGYEGDLRAHLSTYQKDILRRASLNSMPSMSSSTAPGQASPNNNGASAMTPSTPLGAPVHQITPTFKSPQASNGLSLNHYHPAIKAQYRAMVQQYPHTQQAAKSKAYKVGLPAAVSLSLKSTKSATQIPPKQSPVPLPANFLAAMTSSPSTPGSTTRTVPLLNSSQQSSSVNTKPTPTAPPDSTMTSLETSENIAKSISPAKVSTTPVPLPKFALPQPQNTVIIATQVPLRSPAVPDSPQEQRSMPAAGSSSGQATAAPSSSLRTLDTVPSLPSLDTQQESPMPGSNVTIAAVKEAGGCQQFDTVAQLRTGEIHQPEGFPDVPGCESMEFVERMMENLRRASQKRMAS